jgi:predicted aldo/keto reductase-like oxidoreductase
VNRQPLGKTGMDVSALGFGAMRLPTEERGGKPVVRRDEALAVLRRAFELGVNYVDTAYPYCADQSEPIVGEALRAWPGRVYVSTKAPVWSIEKRSDYRRFLEEQLRRLGRPSVDLYFFHGIDWDDYENKIRPLGLVDEACRARDEGLIRHVGFSVHDSPEVFMRLVDEGWAEAVLCQYNLLDAQHAPAMAHARRRGVGVLVMGPVGGGRLGVSSPRLAALKPGGIKTTAELALRFVLANPDVTCALSGMNSVAMVEENVRTAATRNGLSPAETARLAEAMAECQRLADLYCTGCEYCMPCPHGVRIADCFHFANLDRVYGLGSYSRDAYARLKPEQRASTCTECGLCEPKCPQKIPIRRQLKEVAALYGDAAPAASRATDVSHKEKPA